MIAKQLQYVLQLENQDYALNRGFQICRCEAGLNMVHKSMVAISMTVWSYLAHKNVERQPSKTKVTNL